MPPYDAALFAPPAPLALVTLRNAGTGKSATGVAMLMDTGADISLVPVAALTQLGARPEPGRTYELAGFDGGPVTTQAVNLDLLFLGRTFRGLFVVYDQSPGI